MTERTIKHVPLASLQGDPKNPKAHALQTIGESIGRFGYLEPIVVDERTGYIVSGHGRTNALRFAEERGDLPPEGVLIDGDNHWLVPVVTGWSSRSDAEARAALIALNRTTEQGGWQDETLLALLEELALMDDGLLGVGFDEDEIQELRDKLDAIDEGTGGLSPDTGKHLALADVTWGEPTHEVHHGDIWQVGRHILVVAKLRFEHDTWAGYLTGRQFCPYPEPYLLLSSIAEDVEADPILAVQPIVFLAGHLLDKYASVHGEDQVVRLVAGKPGEHDADTGEAEPEPVEAVA